MNSLTMNDSVLKHLARVGVGHDLLSVRGHPPHRAVGVTDGVADASVVVDLVTGEGRLLELADNE